MTDWMTQTRAGFDSALEEQGRWWTEALAGGASGWPPPGPPAESVLRAVEAWRETTCRLIDAQAQALLGAFGDVGGAGPEALLRSWTDAQRELVQMWLAMAGGSGEAAAGPEAGTAMRDSLRRASEHLIESQADWATAWIGAAADAGGRDGA